MASFSGKWIWDTCLIIFLTLSLEFQRMTGLWAAQRWSNAFLSWTEFMTSFSSVEVLTPPSLFTGSLICPSQRLTWIIFTREAQRCISITDAPSPETLPIWVSCILTLKGMREREYLEEGVGVVGKCLLSGWVFGFSPIAKVHRHYLSNIVLDN